ncbi:hypothetical protein [Bradyrhizobium genosp. P]|uniref:hypothetical protein n=1 Tax=Bradyrhizobium genosp. P TaxID=83641 RepID=UPI003CF16052
MSYFEGLSRGSPAHKATRLSERAFRIEPVDANTDSWVAFQDVVDEALSHFGQDGYEVRPTKNTQRPLPGWGTRPVYDSAAIFRTD